MMKKIEYTNISRKRTKSFQNKSSSSSDSDSGARQQKRRNLGIYESQVNPTIVIINSPDVKLAQINPIKIPKALNSMGQYYIQNVSKTNQGGISVRCHTSAQAYKLKGINQLGQCAVVTEYAKSEIQSKGVISGIPSEIPDKEIQNECKRFGVTDVRRIMYKRNGQTGETSSVCLTFNTHHMPTHIQLGYESFTVKPYTFHH